MTSKNSEISKKILELINYGASEQQAIDAVLGAGTYDKLVSDLYNSLNKGE